MFQKKFKKRMNIRVNFQTNFFFVSIDILQTLIYNVLKDILLAYYISLKVLSVATNVGPPWLNLMLSLALTLCES